MALSATLWSDYICPWCYLGTDRTALLVDLGVDVTPRPFELHPEIPPQGVAVRPGGRLDGVFDRIEELCAEAGLPFRRPTRTPNSRRALETAEVVLSTSPSVFPALDAALFRAHWVEGRDIGDPSVLDELVTTAGGDAERVRHEVEAGAAHDAVTRSMDAAREAGITATPAWRFDNGFVIPGPQPREVMERWVTRLAARQG